MKKLGVLLLSLLVCFSLSACGSKPDPTITNFCNAMKQYDFNAMKEYVVDGDKDSVEDPFNNSEDITDETLNILKECVSKMTYEIESSEVTDNTAKVTVKFNYVDLSPVITDAVSEYMQQAFMMALSGANEETMATLFENTFIEKYKSSETTMITDSVEFECENTDNGWKISKVPDDVVNILSSNMVDAFEGFTGDDSSESSENTNEELNVHDVSLGELVELATIKICITGCEEKTMLADDYSEVTAQEGTKFVVFSAEIENITKESISFNNDLPFYDSQGRKYEPYSDAYWYFDNSFSYVDLAPSIKQIGYLVYNVPQDSEGYYIAAQKAETNDVYHFYGK